jgi:hypothetical protein
VIIFTIFVKKYLLVYYIKMSSTFPTNNPSSFVATNKNLYPLAVLYNYYDDCVLTDNTSVMILDVDTIVLNTINVPSNAFENMFYATSYFNVNPSPDDYSVTTPASTEARQAAVDAEDYFESFEDNYQAYQAAGTTPTYVDEQAYSTAKAAARATADTLSSAAQDTTVNYSGLDNISLSGKMYTDGTDTSNNFYLFDALLDSYVSKKGITRNNLDPKVLLLLKKETFKIKNLGQVKGTTIATNWDMIKQDLLERKQILGDYLMLSSGQVSGSQSGSNLKLSVLLNYHSFVLDHDIAIQFVYAVSAPPLPESG